MLEKVKQAVKNDLWLIILDIVSVNAAYYLALLIRFSLGGSSMIALSEFPYIYSQFAPIYTVLCIAVFFLFRLYGSMWKYAGINDINRIAGASLVTALIQVAGTLLTVGRMPRTFYVLGAVLQFLFVLFTRFAYRFVIVESRRLSKKVGNALVIGAGESGRYVINLLDGGSSFRPSAVIDDEFSGMSMDGLPVYASSEIERVIAKHDIKCAVIADYELDNEKRQELKSICDKAGLLLKDYSDYLNFSFENEIVAVPHPAGKKTIPFSPPDISDAEIEEVVEALRSGWITTGPKTKLLERRLAAYIETGLNNVDTESDPDRWKNRVVCTNSATSAEELNFRILGLREGDEVLVPAYTYTASASAAIHCAATVKFVDIQKNGDARTHCPEMDYDALEKAIGPKTKAIVPVDLGGIVCDYDRIFEIVEKKKNLFTPLESDGTPLGDLNSRIQKAIGRVAVVSDCAHSLGASRIIGGKRLFCGAIADFTDFSFHAVKNFTTAEGGASTWKPIQGIDNSEIYKFYQLLSLHGQSKDALAKTKAGAWEYDIIGPWYKCNMTDIMAAIGLRQLDRYPGMLKRRTEIIHKYNSVCDDLGISHLNHHVDGMDSSNHLYLIRIPGLDVNRRNEIIEKLAEEGVSTNVHYKPLPMMTAYQYAGIENYPNTYDYYQNLITLPLHTRLTDDDVTMVCETLRKVVSEYC